MRARRMRVSWDYQISEFVQQREFIGTEEQRLIRSGALQPYTIGQCSRP